MPLPQLSTDLVCAKYLIPTIYSSYMDKTKSQWAPRMFCFHLSTFVCWLVCSSAGLNRFLQNVAEWNMCQERTPYISAQIQTKGRIQDFFFCPFFDIVRYIVQKYLNTCIYHWCVDTIGNQQFFNSFWTNMTEFKGSFGCWRRYGLLLVIISDRKGLLVVETVKVINSEPLLNPLMSDSLLLSSESLSKDLLCWTIHSS